MDKAMNGTSQDIENINPIESIAETGTRLPVLLRPEEGKLSKNPAENIAETASPALDAAAKESIGKRAMSKIKAQLCADEQAKLNAIRNSFHASLAKLIDGSTREIGMQELQRIILENVTSPALRVFLGLIADGAKHVNTSGKELYVLLIGYIAKAFKGDLLDPIDKPPSLLKSVARLCEIVRKYLTV